MRGRIRDRLDAVRQRIRRIERRELREVRRRIEVTDTLVHLSLLVVLPLLVGAVTYLSNRLENLSFFLFPPLASGAYLLFTNPEHDFANPVRFVVGLTAGAICAWIAIEVALVFVYPDLPPTQLSVDAPGAAFAVFLTGVVTWAFDVEEAAAFSTVLLGLLVDPTKQLAFTVSVFLGSSIVALVFVTWREFFYERRAELLYETTRGDDHVLVPMRGPDVEATAILGAKLAAAHEGGTVVLLDVVDEAWQATAERDLLRDHGSVRLLDRGDDRRAGHGSGAAAGAESDGPDDESVPDGSESVARLEELARQVETQVGVPCQVVVAAGERDRASTVHETAARADCDLVAVPYEERHGSLSPFVRSLFGGQVDVLVHRSHAGRTRWSRAMVPVRSASDVAHGMIDFATRLVGPTGRSSVCSCIATDRQRRRTDDMLEDLVEPFEGKLETRVARAKIGDFLEENAPGYDIVFIGASRDRSAASRLISPPTFERIQDIEVDVAIVDRN
ncbi:MAG: HPP family protein [Haloarculaceae archaeon]